MQPMTPHLAEEIWAALGNTTTIMKKTWPKIDKNLLQEENVILPIQINGKKKTEILFPVNSDIQEIEKIVLKNEKILLLTKGQKPKRIIIVPGRIVNVVI